MNHPFKHCCIHSRVEGPVFGVVYKMLTIAAAAPVTAAAAVPVTAAAVPVTAEAAPVTAAEAAMLTWRQTF